MSRRSRCSRTSSRLVVLRTFSKAMGIAGLRFGYALAHPDVAREIAKAKLPYNVNAFTLAAAELVLDEETLMRHRVAEVIRERERAVGALGRLTGLRVFPSQANFFLMRCDAQPGGARSSPACMASTGSWSGMSRRRPSWPGVSASRPAPPRTWMR